MNEENERIETAVRAYCANLPIGEVHVGIAVQSAKHLKSIHHGEQVADNIAVKLSRLRERFNIRTNF